MDDVCGHSCLLLALTFIDVVTGVMASVKKRRTIQEQNPEKGLIEKGILYNVLMISVFILEMILKTAINYKAFYLVLVSAMLIGTYEVSSIVENLIVKITLTKAILKAQGKKLSQ